MIVMNGGKVMRTDSPKRLYDHPANTWSGSPPMNLTGELPVRRPGQVESGTDDKEE